MVAVPNGNLPILNKPRLRNLPKDTDRSDQQGLFLRQV